MDEAIRWTLTLHGLRTALDTDTSHQSWEIQWYVRLKDCIGYGYVTLNIFQGLSVERKIIIKVIIRINDTSISSRDADDECWKTVLDTDTLTARLQGPFEKAEWMDFGDIAIRLLRMNAGAIDIIIYWLVLMHRLNNNSIQYANNNNDINGDAYWWWCFCFDYLRLSYRSSQIGYISGDYTNNTSLGTTSTVMNT